MKTIFTSGSLNSDNMLIYFNFDLLLFNFENARKYFIVRHFLCVYRLSKFCLLVDTAACGGKEGLFALWLKNTSRRSGVFSAKRQKNIPGYTR